MIFYNFTPAGLKTDLDIKHVEQRGQCLVAAPLLPCYGCAPFQKGHDRNDLHVRSDIGSDLAGLVFGAARAAFSKEESHGACGPHER